MVENSPISYYSVFVQAWEILEYNRFFNMVLKSPEKSWFLGTKSWKSPEKWFIFKNNFDSIRNQRNWKINLTTLLYFFCLFDII